MSSRVESPNIYLPWSRGPTRGRSYSLKPLAVSTTELMMNSSHVCLLPLGVHSPTLSGLSQADAYRPFRLPIIFIGDSRLGGISTTLASYEALLIRGYSIEAVLLFRDAYYKNHEYLADYFARNAKGTLVRSVPHPPLRAPDDPYGEQDKAAMEAYYASICDSPPSLPGSVSVPQNTSDSGIIPSVLSHLERRHNERIADMASMPERTLSSVWWPFVQHANIPGAQEKHRGVTVIDSALGDFLEASGPGSPSTLTSAIHEGEDGARTSNSSDKSNCTSLLSWQFDGSASWWTQALGHAHPQLTLAAAHAAGRYGHVIFPLATHEPALTLAERLLAKGGPGEGWAHRVFFSDNGSTGTEVALKMAMRASALRYPVTFAPSAANKKRELHILGISGSYHGDTIGAMDACEGGVYNSAVEWHRERGFWFDPPRVGVRDGGQVTVSIPASSWGLDWDVNAAETEFAKLTENRPATGGESGLGSTPESTVTTTVERGDACTLRVGFSDDPSLMRDAVQHIYDVPARLARSDPLVAIYTSYISAALERLVRREKRTFGALILEPILMGAGGMVWIDPLFQRVLIDVVRAREDLWSHTSGNIKSDVTPFWRGLPVIFDEVFVGLYRLGFLTSSSILGTTPDISVLAKIFTGGLVPMSVTLASNSIYNAFLGLDKKDALLHGHSYTAHPVGCAVAGKTLDTIQEISSGGGEAGRGWINAKERWLAISSALPASGPALSSSQATRGSENSNSSTTEGVWSLWDPEFLAVVSQHYAVDEVMSLGTVLSIHLSDDAAGMFHF